MIKIGDKIKKARIKKQLTQQELSELINVSRSAISNWEVGRHYPDIDMIVELSKILDFSLDELFKEDTIMVKKIATEQKKGTQRKRIIIALSSVIVILLLITSSIMYSEVGWFHDMFSPRQYARVEQSTNDQWTEVKFEHNENGYLEFGGIGKRTLVNDANNHYSLDIQILTTTNEVVMVFSLEPGTIKKLDQLKRNTEYILRIKGESDEYSINIV